MPLTDKVTIGKYKYKIALDETGTNLVITVLSKSDGFDATLEFRIGSELEIHAVRRDYDF